MTDTDLNQLFRRPLSDAERGFLRRVKTCGGAVDISGLDARGLAMECRRAGYLHIQHDHHTAKLTGLGQAYLDRIIGVH